MKFGVKVPDIAAAMAAERQRLASAVTGVMRDAANDIKDEMRRQTLAAGLGQKVANAWRAQAYPNRQGKVSLRPTGMVWSNMPVVASHYITGQAIVPVHGGKFLAIPSPLIKQRATPKGKKVQQIIADLEKQFSQKMIILPGKAGHYLGLFDISALKGKTARKKGASKPAHKLALYYTFVPMVKGRRAIDLVGVGQRIAGDMPTLIAEALS